MIHCCWMQWRKHCLQLHRCSELPLLHCQVHLVPIKFTWVGAASTTGRVGSEEIAGDSSKGFFLVCVGRDLPCFFPDEETGVFLFFLFESGVFIIFVLPGVFADASFALPIAVRLAFTSSFSAKAAVAEAFVAELTFSSLELSSFPADVSEAFPEEAVATVVGDTSNIFVSLNS